ncbi:hypothetical protein [Pinirhizobacter sp.]|jgi:hypothetical protein|uniref:hypothetical protein n=1 Tax=Pinirhizobacter sp. TaxID=2950432 RepID=UPI002F407CA6
MSLDVVQRALAITGAMHEAATRHDWQAVAVLEAERAVLLQGPLPADEGMLKSIKAMLAIDAMTKTRAREARDNI